MSKSNHPPAFLEYPRDLLFDDSIAFMTTIEFGAYTLLKYRAWFEKPVATIPTDDRVLARWTRLTAEQWAECKGAVLSCFKPYTDGRLIEPRLSKEYQQFMASKKKKSEAGKKGANMRWKNDDIAMALPCDCHSDAIAVPMRSHGIQPNNPITPNNPVTLNKPKDITQRGSKGIEPVNPDERKPPGFLDSSSLGSLVAGLSGPHELPCDSLDAKHVFVVFRELFFENGVAGATDLSIKARRAKVTPARWAMLFLDKIQYAYEHINGTARREQEETDPVALTVAGFKRNQSPTDSACVFFREIFLDKIGNPETRGKRFDSLNGAFVSAELTRRKGKRR